MSENTEQTEQINAEPSEAQKRFAALVNETLRARLDDKTNLVTRDGHVLMANALTEVGVALCSKLFFLEEQLENMQTCELQEAKDTLSELQDMLTEAQCSADGASESASEAASQAEDASVHASNAEEKLSEAKDMLP